MIAGILSAVATGSAKYKKFKKAGKVLSAVSGFFGSKKKRAKEKAKREEFSQLLGTQYGMLEDTVAEVGQEFDTRREMLGESQTLQQEQAVMGYGLGQEQLSSQIGMTNLQTGAGEEAMQLAQKEFANQQMARSLQAREQRFNLGLREASRMRDIQAAGFALDKAAADKGLTSKNYGQSLMDMMEG
tara:strand:+ start:4006 stop:4563 length:558 start_codon:yes stop_codon:yes gene_type:complete